MRTNFIVLLSTVVSSAALESPVLRQDESAGRQLRHWTAAAKPPPPSPPPLGCSSLSGRTNARLMNKWCYELSDSTHGCDNYFTWTDGSGLWRLCYSAGLSNCAATSSFVCNPPAPPPPPVETSRSGCPSTHYEQRAASTLCAGTYMGLIVNLDDCKAAVVSLGLGEAQHVTEGYSSGARTRAHTHTNVSYGGRGHSNRARFYDPLPGSPHSSPAWCHRV